MRWCQTWNQFWIFRGPGCFLLVASINLFQCGLRSLKTHGLLMRSVIWSQRIGRLAQRVELFFRLPNASQVFRRPSFAHRLHRACFMYIRSGFVRLRGDLGLYLVLVIPLIEILPYTIYDHFTRRSRGVQSLEIFRCFGRQSILRFALGGQSLVGALKCCSVRVRVEPNRVLWSPRSRSRIPVQLRYLCCHGIRLISHLRSMRPPPGLQLLVL